jgi:ATP-dependent helicase/nuclease subunit B
MVHRILEQFIGEQVALPPDQRIQPTTPWGPTDVARLLVLADAVFADYVRRGLTGRDLFWEVQKAAVARDLKRFLVEDSCYRLEKGAVPEGVEYRFGFDGPPAVTVPLDDRRTVRFRGSVDRVDRLPDRIGPDGGPVYVVIDYKTGGAYGVNGLDDDPVVRGTKLQLPVYGLAVRQQMGAAGVEAQYWFVSDKSDFARHGYELTPARTERVDEVLRILVDGIEGGRFPARPAQGSGWDTGNCRICPFDGICPTDRQRAWERKRHDPSLAAYTGLAEADGTD